MDAKNIHKLVEKAKKTTLKRMFMTASHARSMSLPSTISSRTFVMVAGKMHSDEYWFQLCSCPNEDGVL